MTRLALILPLLLAACLDPPLSEGARGFAQTCARCHGADARGGGPLAAELPVPPADLTQLTARHGTFPMRRILTGPHTTPGQASPGLLPEFAPLMTGPLVAWTAPDGTVLRVHAAHLAVARYLEGLQE